LGPVCPGTERLSVVAPEAMTESLLVAAMVVGAFLWARWPRGEEAFDGI